MDSHKELTYQDVLIDLATNFINLPIDEMDQGLHDALRRIVEYSGALRASINQFTEDRRYYQRLYRWAALAEALDTLAYVETPNCDEILPMFERDEALIIDDLADEQYPEVTTLLKPFGGAAVISVPIANDKGLFGFISMSWDR